MPSFIKKYSIITVRECWFRNESNLFDIFRPVALLHLKDRIPVPWFFIRKNSYTVENDLTISSQEIQSNFIKALRQQIRIAEADGITCSFHNDIEGFVSFFNDFAYSKNIAPTSKGRIIEMGNNFLMSYASLNGEILVAHSYILDKEIGIARAFHSASRRLDATIDKNLVGRANKLLHYTEIMYFKEKGFKIYDFGGYSGADDKRNLKGINEFKLSFGGKVVQCENYYSPIYLLFRRIAVFLRIVEKQEL